MKKRATLLTMNAKAHRAMALQWMMFGFDCSGPGFHGVAFDRKQLKNPKSRQALERNLMSYFNAIYEEKIKR